MRKIAPVRLACLQLPCGTIHRWPTIGEAERMKSKGECRRLHLPGRRHPVYRLIPQAEPSKSELTPPSITTTDMQINAGIGSKPEIFRVKVKVREFGKSRLVCA